MSSSNPSPAKYSDQPKSFDEQIEFRRQTTRMWITYIGMLLFAVISVYCVIFSQDKTLKTGALTAVTGLITGIIGYYFGQKKGE